MGWKVTIDQISSAGGRAHFEHNSDTPIAQAVTEALAQARLSWVTAGQYQITVVPASVSSSREASRFTGKHSIGEHLPGEAIPAPEPQAQLGVCPHCGLTETVTPSLAHPDQLTCWPPSGGCGAMWRGARTGPR